MATYVGRVETASEIRAAEASQGGIADKTRAELMEEAESLGVKVPQKASKAEIAKLIEEAPVM